MTTNKLTPDDYLQMDIEHLLYNLGRALDSTRQGLPKKFEKLVDEGEKWFKKNRKRLSDIICGNSIITKLKEDSNKRELFITIADIIAATYLNSPPVFILSALIIKIGLNEFCK